MQYYGWGLLNRDALMPTAAQIDQADAVVERARLRLHGKVVIDYVTPDYYAAGQRPAWAAGGAVFSMSRPPVGSCPATPPKPLTGLQFPTVHDSSLAAIWTADAAFARLSRHRLDAGTLPILRPPRDRFRRLPLPGLRADRRRRGHGPRLRALPGSRCHGCRDRPIRPETPRLPPHAAKTERPSFLKKRSKKLLMNSSGPAR